MVHRTQSLVWIAASALALAACGQSPIADPSTQIGANPVLPEPKQYLLPPMQIAPPEPWKANESPVAAPGLRVQALARNMIHPRQVYTLPNGDVLVVESDGPKAPINRPKDLIMGIIKGHAGTGAHAPNRITLLRDTTSSGTANVRTVFLEHLNSPFGVALVGHDLYIADTDAIIRYPYVEGQTTMTAPGVKLVDLPGGPIDHHWTKSMVASPDGSKLYVGVGSNSNITENGFPAGLDRAAIWEIDRATGAHRIFASGTRNPTAMSWEPQTNKLWASVQERDELGPNLVPDYITSVRDGGFYGWPYSYFGQHLDPRVRPQRPDLVARAIVPDYAMSSHAALLGLAFYTGSSLPAAYRGGAFVGEHGSWDRSPLNGYKVVYVPFADGRPNGMPRNVLTGFLTSDDHAKGRPVGLAIDKSGALLVADDLGNTVWRVSSAAPPQTVALNR